MAPNRQSGSLEVKNAAAPILAMRLALKEKPGNEAG
jgi:hypothetical protein